MFESWAQPHLEQLQIPFNLDGPDDMIWIATTALTILLLITSFLVLRKKAAGIPLLEATIATDDGYNFCVLYKKLHPEMKPVEYIRMILYFSAKMIYIAPSDARSIVRHIKILGDVNINQSTDIAAVCGARIAIRETSSIGGKKVRAVLGFRNILNRSIWTSIPATWYEDQFLYSLLAIVQTSLPKLDVPRIKLLQVSLERMASMYLDGSASPNSIAAIAQIPGQAFLDADMSICATVKGNY